MQRQSSSLFLRLRPPQSSASVLCFFFPSFPRLRVSSCSRFSAVRVLIYSWSSMCRTAAPQLHQILEASPRNLRWLPLLSACESFDPEFSRSRSVSRGRRFKMQITRAHTQRNERLICRRRHDRWQEAAQLDETDAELCCWFTVLPLISFSTNLSPPHPISRHYIPLFIHLISFPPFSFNVLSVQYSVCATKIAVEVRCCVFHMAPIHLPWRKTVL